MKIVAIIPARMASSRFPGKPLAPIQGISMVEHVRRRTGVALRGALAHVDPATRSVFKTLATSPEVDLFLLGTGLPALGVPVNAHLQTNASIMAGGNGAVRG